MATPFVTGPGLSVRRYEAEDRPFVAALSDEALAEYQSRPSRYVLSHLERATTRAFIAGHDDTRVGLLLLDGQADRWWVLAIAVCPRFRARGIGSALLRAAEAHAIAHGGGALSLFTADANLAALDLFLRRGFRIVERRERFYARQQDACKLTKELLASPRP